jgi:hypothetical protein
MIQQYPNPIIFSSARNVLCYNASRIGKFFQPPHKNINFTTSDEEWMRFCLGATEYVISLYNDNILEIYGKVALMRAMHAKDKDTTPLNFFLNIGVKPDYPAFSEFYNFILYCEENMPYNLSSIKENYYAKVLIQPFGCMRLGFHNQLLTNIHQRLKNYRKRLKVDFPAQPYIKYKEVKLADNFLAPECLFTVSTPFFPDHNSAYGHYFALMQDNIGRVRQQLNQETSINCCNFLLNSKVVSVTNDGKVFRFYIDDIALTTLNLRYATEVKHTPAESLEPLFARYIEPLYRQILNSPTKDVPIAAFACLYWLLAHATPCLRGSAAITQIIICACMLLFGFVLVGYADTMPDLDALTCTLPMFIENFQQRVRIINNKYLV